jgi:hypothetical protein
MRRMLAASAVAFLCMASVAMASGVNTTSGSVAKDDFDPRRPCGAESQCVIPTDDGAACTSESACGVWAGQFVYLTGVMWSARPWGGGTCIAIVEGPWTPWQWRQAQRISFVAADC